MITVALAAWIPTLTFETLPACARVRAKLAIFDACGTALAGVHHPAVQHLRQAVLARVAAGRLSWARPIPEIAMRAPGSSTRFTGVMHKTRRRECETPTSPRNPWWS